MRRASTSLRFSVAALLASLALGACADRDPTGPAMERGPGAVSRDAGIQAFTGNIRIGVVPAASSVTIGSAADYEIRDRVTGALLMSGSNGTATVTLQSVILSWYRLQVMCGTEAAVATRKAAAEAKGYPTFTELAPVGCTRLFIGRFAPPPANTFAARTAFRNQLIAEGLAAGDSFWAVKADPGLTVYRVTRGSQSVDATNPVVLTSSDGLVTIGGVRYRGVAEVRVNSAGSLAGVNELPMEQYLYGVVPRELGPVAFPELEALKAQAVAARTYALVGLGKRGSDGYDLLATTADQVYGGHAAEHPLSSQAVDETAGIAAVHDGKLITALYSSTAGGFTANNEEAFASAPVAYLRGVPDAQRGQAFEHVPSLDVFRRHGNPTSLRNAKEGDFESNWASLHRWHFEWSADEISAVISAYAQQPVGKVLAINVTERGPSGRALAIEYVTEAGTFTDTKDRIRTSLKFINASGAQQSLPSTMFYIEPVLDRKTGEVEGFEAWGGGFGHGVGLSQTGAVGMAEKGRTYDEILKHYYRDIDLVAWY
ncbi:MAG TPA: SpoIID/LytB domain-containing protein [Longimicrobium sp.]|nr:SpoIID/LytB domain-containing protein [Longimicrobium sp.]